MKTYELLYIIDSTVADDKREELINKVKTIVEENGGKAGEIDKWGVRKYAYPIDYKTEGYYVLMSFEAPTTVPQVLESQLLIMEGVVRHMITFKN
ncbi:MAG: 30S ribosomal protein S6 [Clostridia bacterium]|nr:30S ribosomal protein S6 [Clostridia bacterium]